MVNDTTYKMIKKLHKDKDLVFLYIDIRNAMSTIFSKNIYFAIHPYMVIRVHLFFRKAFGL